MPVTLRPADENDAAFLYRLYRSTRADEIAAWGWTPEQAEPFLRMQFDAQRRSQACQMPNGEQRIVQVAGQDAGRTLVDRSGAAFLLADVVLLPEFRGAGIGTQLLRQLQADAASAAVPVRLHVAKTNRAWRLYERLGFAVTADDGVYLEMAWHAPRDAWGACTHLAAPGNPLTRRIVDFLAAIGLPVYAGRLTGDTFLPGILLDRGSLRLDEARLAYPGDLLHEAGHLAVMPPDRRRAVHADAGKDAAEEMMAIAWSYAALVHLRLDPAVVFHPAGYRGGSQALLENFAARRYIAVPMLQWLGMAADDRRAAELGVAPYPWMIRWLREA